MSERNTKRKHGCLVSHVMTKLNTSRHQVKELHRQQMATTTKLSKLNHDKKMLEREVIELRKKIDERGGRNRKAIVAYQDDDEETIIHKNTTFDRYIDYRIKEQQKMKGMTKKPCENASSAISVGKPHNSNNTTRTEQTITTKAMRQRLILLRHASQCTATNCKVTRHCVEMKGVWNHIVNDDCNDPNCNVRHCLSSRCVLSHHRRCQIICDSVKLKDTFREK